MAPCDLWIFPKLKSFEMEEVSDPQRDSGKYDRADDGNWENCVRAQGACLQETEMLCPCCCPVILVPCVFFSKCLYFSYSVAGYLLHRPGTHQVSLSRGREDGVVRKAF